MQVSEVSGIPEPFMAVRIIPLLDIKSPDLVKSIYLEGRRVLGEQEEFARSINQCEQGRSG